MTSLSVLLTNITLAQPSGTVKVTCNIAAGLRRLGHRPMVYSPDPGPAADLLRRLSIPVVNDIGLIRQPPDIIHAHHAPTSAAAIARFPHVPAVFVCHDFVAWHDLPPALPQIRRWLAVDELTADRLVLEHGIPAERVEVLLNAVDTKLFRPVRTLPACPLRALAYAKNAEHLPAVAEACAARGLTLDVLGAGVDRLTRAPHDLLAEYDIVFTSALSAIEAMACGAAVIACDGRGLAGMVTTASYNSWRRLNFGLRTLRRPVEATALIEEIDRYDSTDAASVTARVRSEADLAPYLDTLCGLYRRVMAEHAQSDRPASDETDIALARHIQTWSPSADPARDLMAARLCALGRALNEPRHPEPLTVDGTMRFSVEHTDGWHPLFGFSHPESWGVWTDAAEAMMLLAHTDRMLGDVDLEFFLRPFVNARHPRLHCAVTANGQVCGEWTFSAAEDSGKASIRTVHVPAQARRDGILCLGFSLRDPAAPRALGIGTDNRNLGIGLSTLTLRRPHDVT